MEFYGLLAQYYDEIFPLKQQQKTFLRTYLNNQSISSVLDVGCGTGSFVLALNDWGVNAMGIDLSPAMIEIAKQKALTKQSQARFALINMLDLAQIPENFDGLLCLGNTLAHLAGPLEIQEALTQFRLKATNLLIQIVNYDRVLAQNITVLPIIETANLIFRRFYRRLPTGHIEFTTEIEVSGQKLRATNTLFPLTQNQLRAYLNDTGWAYSQTWWGDFAGEPWSMEAPATIVTAQASTALK